MKMKKLLFPFLILLAFTANAQYNNSWIDYSKTYYRFSLLKDTLTRIPQSVLSAAGLGNVNADEFQLWRNGVQVRLYTSVSGAPLPANGYIEFWGQMNDGKPDKALYRNPDFQLSDKYSMENDTSSYFLTVNPGGNNLRYVNDVNTAPSAQTPDPYFIRKVDFYYNSRFNRGMPYLAGEWVYSASYDEGEGFVGPSVGPGPGNAFIQQVQNMHVYTGAPANSVSVWANVVGGAALIRNVKIRLNSSSLYEVPLPLFGYAKINIPNVPLSYITNPEYVSLVAENVSLNGGAADNYNVAAMGISYPAKFDFDLQRNYKFQLAPSATGNYLVIDNFNYGTAAPVLYNMTDGLRYQGDITSTPGKVKFVLPASAQPVREFILVNQEASNYFTINGLSSKTFTNFSNAAMQGDYLIISNPLLYDDGNGNNYVEQYRQYRASALGGGFNAKVYDIHEIMDQFGYGIRRHPDGLRNFILWAKQTFSTPPRYVFIIGRGVSYYDYLGKVDDPNLDKISMVPTFGWPPSDILLTCLPGTLKSQIPIGRLSAINGTEIGHYLDKVKEYEDVLRVQRPTVAESGWMKDILHVSGGKTTDEGAQFESYMNGYANIARDTLYGGYIESFAKTSNSPVQEANNNRIAELFANGLSVVGYFGHSSANTFEYNLSNPENYHSQGKYPFFNVSGCMAGNLFTFDLQRITGNSMSLSEKYVLAPQRGSIAFLADTHFGIPYILDTYNRNLYYNFSTRMYGQALGDQIHDVIERMNIPNIDLSHRLHLEEITLHGDPALKLTNFAKPDYVIEQQMVSIDPNIITVADNNFKIDIKMRNIGKAINDSINVTVKRQLPNDSIMVLFDKKILAIKYMDSLQLDVPILPTRDKGLNKLIVTLDNTNRVDEAFENNNTVTKEFYIFEDELRPISPYNYAIVNTQNITFSASTAAPLGVSRNYQMEIDTTELFNSPFKKQYNTSTVGGVVDFTPTNLNFTDSTVYYWRVSIVPDNPGGQQIWNTVSFVYLQNGGSGYNQSHYFQFLKNSYAGMSLGDDRTFTYGTKPILFTVKTGHKPYANETDDYSIAKNNAVEQSGLAGPLVTNSNVLRFYIIDGNTMKFWKNQDRGGGMGQYGSFAPLGINQYSQLGFYHFDISTPAHRQVVKNFFDSIPSGNIIVMTNAPGAVSDYRAAQMKADEVTLGTTDILYYKLKNIGFTMLDSFKTHIPFIFVTEKGTNTAIMQEFGLAESDKMLREFTVIAKNTDASMQSDVFGPALQWQTLKWRGASTESPSTDNNSIDVIGIKPDGTEQTLTTVYQAQDTSLSWVNAVTYPKIRLKLNTQDTVNLTPYQLRYWRVNGKYVPEGALIPSLNFAIQDSVAQGDSIHFSVAFKNISETNFASLIKSRVTILDRNNNPTVINITPRKALVPGDTLIISGAFDTRNLAGINTFILDVNPDNDQPEQYHFNNILYKTIKVTEDLFNPQLDVTFDGVHILSRDIISSKPNIIVKLKDESKFLLLKDTALLKVQVRFPDQSLHTYHFGDTMRFIPADINAGENTATIEFKPYFPDDGEYEFIVSGKDMNGNPAGYLNYKVIFNVINKSMISNLMNYPNPFTTSTAFVFTLTGQQIPQNMRIQILTISGKVVREITQQELGPIHIGNNITEYKWDGTDMYGQKLANGVYLYRVLTNLNGKKIDKFDGRNSNGDVIVESVNSTDRFFNKGYGKMYLMR